MSSNAINYRCKTRLFFDRLLASRLLLTHADYPQLTDTQLVVATTRGDNRAYEHLVRRYQKLVYNVAYNLLHNHEQAADVTQDTFVKAFKALSTFRQEAALKPWLLRIASNTALNKIRDEKGHLHESLGGGEGDEPFIDPPASTNVEKEVEMRLSQVEVLDALNKIDSRRRFIFLLHYQHGLSYAEIAATTQESESAIKALLFRTREQLRTMLKELRP